MQKTYSAFFRELKDFYTFEEIAQNFGLPLKEDEDENPEQSENSAENEDKYKNNRKSLKEVLDRLCQKRICKYGKREEIRTDDINDDEEEKGITSESSADVNDNGNYYNFDFVGIVSYRNFIFYIYPKYIFFKKQVEEKLLRPKYSKTNTNFNGELNEYNKVKANIDDHFKTVMKIINEFAKDNAIQPLNFVNNPIGKVDPISFMVFMIHQYYENGLYYKEETVIETNGDGEIDWDRTINETTPIIQNNIPYYVELKTIQKQEASVNFLRNLHMAILSECSERLEEMGILKYLGISPVYFEYRKISNLGSEDYLERIINNELRVQNANIQKIQLYNMLHYIKEGDTFARSKTLSIYGTRKFEVIWENVLKALFDDLYDNDRHYLHTGLKGAKPKICEIEKELNIEFLLNKEEKEEEHIRKNEEIRYFMGVTSIKADVEHDFIKKNPSKDIVFTGGYRLKPDIVSIFGNKILILDAKYYCAKEEETDGKFSISEVPGATDISKQFEYEMLFRKGLKSFRNKDTGEKKDFDYVNMFLIPMKLNAAELGTDEIKDTVKKDYLADYSSLRKSFGLIDETSDDKYLIRISSFNPIKCFEKFLKKESFLSKENYPDVEKIIEKERK